MTPKPKEQPCPACTKYRETDSEIEEPLNEEQQSAQRDSSSDLSSLGDSAGDKSEDELSESMLHFIENQISPNCLAAKPAIIANKQAYEAPMPPPKVMPMPAERLAFTLRDSLQTAGPPRPVARIATPVSEALPAAGSATCVLQRSASCQTMEPLPGSRVAASSESARPS